MSVPEFFIQGGAGTTTMQGCSFFIFAAAPGQVPNAALSGISNAGGPFGLVRIEGAEGALSIVDPDSKRMLAPNLSPSQRGK
jgi:hypothetical protein